MSSQLVFITSYPPRECGIATYTKDLINALQTTFGRSLEPVVCALETGPTMRMYGKEVRYTLCTTQPKDYVRVAKEINGSTNLKAVCIQHEFGLFGGTYGENLLLLLHNVRKPVIITFHTVLPKPDAERLALVKKISDGVKEIVVMTKDASNILKTDYRISETKITVIPHGTHPVPSANSDKFRKKLRLPINGPILATFGFLSSGKNIETALHALPGIIREFPNTHYLVIGETHPEVAKQEGEAYRNLLKEIIDKLSISAHVHFIDKYLPTDELLEYLTAADIYLFTSKDPNQTVSGTFAYALSCGCPMVSTPIPHAREILTNKVGRMVGFEQPAQFTDAVLELLRSTSLMQRMRANALQLMEPTKWSNVAIAHDNVFRKVLSNSTVKHRNTLPAISAKPIKRVVYTVPA